MGTGLAPADAAASADESLPPAADAEPSRDLRGQGGESAAEWARADAPPTALAWVRPAAVAASDTHVIDEAAAPPLLTGRPRRSSLRAAAIPVLLAAGLTTGYSATVALWPLDEVAPVVTEVDVPTVASPQAALTWPETGTAGVGVQGLGAAVSSSEALPIASITKVVSSLMVLDRQPLSPGEQGPSYEFTRADSQDYWRYLGRDESALDVPAGGSLTQYQLLQGTMIGSANNYIDRLAREIWGSDWEFAAAAEEWLSSRGLDGTRIVEPTGIDARNTATPRDLVRLAEMAMADPVLGEIASTATVELPGAGEVVNSNPLLGEDRVNGVKTGRLRGSWNLLSSKEIFIGDTPVLLTASVIGQDSSEQRSAETRALFAQLEEALATQEPTVPAGTVAGEVSTVWGETASIVSDEPARVVLWNGAAASTEAEIDLADRREEGDRVGTLTVVGPLDRTETSLSLAAPIEGPSLWWRLTHPLELFGLMR